MKRAKFKGIITITGIAGSLQRVKRRRCLWSSRTRSIGMSKIVEWEVALKATFHLTISMRGQRATGKIRRNNYRHGSCGPPLTGKTMSVFLIFTQGTHRNVKNRWVRSSLLRCLRIEIVKWKVAFRVITRACHSHLKTHIREGMKSYSYMFLYMFPLSACA